jgi:membrane protease YdiL (CAAX protease family)
MKRNQQSDIFMLIIFMAFGSAWFAFRIFNGGELRMLPIASVFMMLIFAPMAEEMFFRGVVQAWIKQKLTGGLYFISYANILASLFFAFTHVFIWGVSHSIFVYIPSLIFGFLYDRTGKIHYPMILHVFYNFNIFIV